MSARLVWLASCEVCEKTAEFDGVLNSDIAGYGLTVVLSDPRDPHIERRAGIAEAKRIHAIANSGGLSGRAVYQDNGRTVIVWLEPDANPHTMRKWLEFKGVHVSCVTAHYDPVMA